MSATFLFMINVTVLAAAESPKHLFFQPQPADNVGIGFTENPLDYKLAVNGDLYVHGDIYQGVWDQTTSPPSIAAQKVKLLLFSRNGDSYYSGNINLVPKRYTWSENRVVNGLELERIRTARGDAGFEWCSSDNIPKASACYSASPTVLGEYTVKYANAIDGNIGIGLASAPQAKLHIQRAAYEGPHGVFIDEDNPESNGNPKIELRGLGRNPYIDFTGGSWAVQGESKDFDTRIQYYFPGKLLSFEQSGNSGVPLNGYTFDNKVNAKFEIDVLAAHPQDHLALSTDRVGLDVAELFETEEPIEIGDVLVVGTKERKLKKSSRPYEEEIIGIVSGSPALLFEGSETKLGSQPNRFIAGSKPPVALSGRVPVKVSLQNGPIKPGDYLTSSSQHGVAMRATEPGAIVGIALETYSGGGEARVLAFVNIQERNATAIVRQLGREIDELKRKVR